MCVTDVHPKPTAATASASLRAFAITKRRGETNAREPSRGMSESSLQSMSRARSPRDWQESRSKRQRTLASPDRRHEPASVELMTTGGARVVTMRVPVAPFPMPSCSRPDRLAPLLLAAQCVAGALPISSSRKMNGALRLWRSALLYFGVKDEDVCAGVVIGLLILRCAPPADPPPFAKRPVLPSTAAADIDILRRAARECIDGMEIFLAPLSHERVLRLQRSIGGRVAHIKTNKRPFLWATLMSAVNNTVKDPTYENVRSTFALTLGFFFATRGAELLSFEGQDINMSDNGDILVTFRHVKTRQSLFGLHRPFVIAGRAPVLTRMFDLFNATIGFNDGLPLFHKWSKGKHPVASSLSRDWLSHAVRRWDPLCSPHSLRVGCATEAWAAGIPLPQIQALGRWDSVAALLYILGSLDETAAATSLLGKGELFMTKDGIRSSANVKAKWWPASPITDVWCSAAPSET